MLDFVQIKIDYKKYGKTSVIPAFQVGNSKDLMIRGRDFYAIWDEANNRWSTDETVAIRLIDDEMRQFAKDNSELIGQLKDNVYIRYLSDSSSGSIDQWHKYVQKQMRDNYIPLDSKVTFKNQKVKRDDYITKRVDYDPAPGDISAYDKMMSTLFNPPEREKLEWAVGAILTGESRNIQKFVVLYGAPGTGKSTFLNVVEKLFAGYWSVFEARALGQVSNQFSLEPFKDNPLVAIQHDGDLSHIGDNTRLNSIVSHEMLVINEKFKTPYPLALKTFLFMGTNEPVDITNARSGLNRRLIDVYPSGNLLPKAEYDQITSQINFELGAIADHCIKVYQSLGANYYNHYEPRDMQEETDDFYNFICEDYDKYIHKTDAVTLREVWIRYKDYCLDAGVKYPYSYKQVRKELKSYFYKYYDQYQTVTGHVRSFYKGFKVEKLNRTIINGSEKKEDYDIWLDFKEQKSLLDDVLADCPAQEAVEREGNWVPKVKWENCRDKLKDISTDELHFVQVPENHIVIDFDIKGQDGSKSLDRNIMAASKFPPTYAELSKSGAGIHLHYIYDGDVSELSRVYSDNVEVKVFTGNSSLRRRLSLCNDIPIAHISSGLPLKGDKTVVNWEGYKNEKTIRTMIIKNLRKEYHANTKPSVDYIYKILEDAYREGVKYDVSDMEPAILSFAASSSNNSAYCVALVSDMKFKSEEEQDASVKYSKDTIIFYDVEVFPNVFIVCYKAKGKDNPVVKLINPSAEDMIELMQFKLIGFNNRKYDNHIIYARSLGYTNYMLYDLSKRIIDGASNAMISSAYNVSYTDVYDFAATKQSLKKWEIQLGLFHLENEHPWDEDLDEKYWEEVATYCANDVMATEAVFDHLEGDFLAREMLAALSGLTLNDTTNKHTQTIIVGKDPNPQSKFVYTDLSKIFPGYEFNEFGFQVEKYDILKNQKGVHKSYYRGEDPGEGGYVYANPGQYKNIALLDIASMHPHSAITLNIFGEYTKRFKELVDARIAIKHKDFEKAGKLLDGKLKPYLTNPEDAKRISYALKIAINSVYGLTSAKFDNKLRDPRNKDNIVAKYGALFMINLKHEVEERGFTVIHIKTDSIKIADATPEIIQFVSEYGKKYGYTFEHEATYSKMCLVNDAVYIAKVAEEDGQKVEPFWTATGTQFQIPYVFKTLFSHEPITFEDLCETKTVSKGNLYLDMNEALGEDEHNYHFVGRVGLFTPVVEGAGGGYLMRTNDEGKYSSVTGTKKADGKTKYRWMESAMAKDISDDMIDRSYYSQLVDDAVHDISEYGDFEEFVA